MKKIPELAYVVPDDDQGDAIYIDGKLLISGEIDLLDVLRALASQGIVVFQYLELSDEWIERMGYKNYPQNLEDLDTNPLKY